MSTRARRGLLAVLGLGAVVLAACTPVVPSPPPPSAPSGAAAWCSTTSSPPAAADHFAVVEQDDGSTDVVKFQAATQQDVDRKVATLERTGDVLAVEQDQLVHAVAVNPGDDQYYPSQWGFTPSEADLPGAWTSAPEPDGTGVRVAVIDSGVDGDHPDLAANVEPGKDFVVSDAASNFGRIDGYGHGTHVAGIIAAADNTIGVVGGAPRARIVPVRVLNCSGSGTMANVAAGVLWAADPSGGNAKVINLSLGGNNPDSGLQAAVTSAVNDGVVVVAAAGNGGPSASNLYPAAYEPVISVGAEDNAGGFVRFNGGSDVAESLNASSVTGALDVVARVSPADWTPATPQVVVSKLDATTGYEPLRLNPDGRLQLTAFVGTVQQIATSPGFVPASIGTRGWLRVTRSGASVAFFWAPDSTTTPTSWTSLGTASIAPGAFDDNALPLSVGGSSTVGTAWNGRIVSVAVRDAIDAPVPVALFDARPQAVGSPSWTSTTGETWTLYGAAAVHRSAASYSNTNPSIDIVAPGTSVLSTTFDNLYGPKSGTSMATPHVAAVAALVEQHCPGVTPARVKQILQETAAVGVEGFAAPAGLVRGGAALNHAC